MIDRGSGVAAEIAGRIFDPFFTTKPQGLGVGLSLSRSIVESHGGCLEFSANADSGTTFSLTLPLEDREEPPDVETV